MRNPPGHGDRLGRVAGSGRDYPTPHQFRRVHRIVRRVLELDLHHDLVSRRTQRSADLFLHARVRRGVELRHLRRQIPELEGLRGLADQLVGDQVTGVVELPQVRALQHHLLGPGQAGHHPEFGVLLAFLRAQRLLVDHGFDRPRAIHRAQRLVPGQALLVLVDPVGRLDELGSGVHAVRGVAGELPLDRHPRPGRRQPGGDGTVAGRALEPEQRVALRGEPHGRLAILAPAVLPVGSPRPITPHPPDGSRTVTHRTRPIGQPKGQHPPVREHRQQIP
ncbi:hypothetical protein Q5425_04885 [Amycolatopsis sp. A133]|nr:hypothetical protein [Amycolatopsis sp. A133]MDQ7803052.1 hypothetical protein [Amycolatopsis sp. A133]